MLGLLLLLALSQAGDAGLRRTAVIAVDGCEAIPTRERVSLVRDELAPRLGPALLSEAETAARLGGLPGRPPAELRRALERAREAFYAGRANRGLPELDRVEDEAMRLSPSEERWALLRDAMSTRALMTLKSDPAAAERGLRRLLAVDPGFEPDAAEFPPSYLKVVDAARAAVKALGTNRLDVRVDPPGRPVFVAGRPVGKSPLSVERAPGDYLVEAGFPRRGVGRTVTVPRPGEPPNAVVLAIAIEGAMAPGAGPCVAVQVGRPEALVRAFDLLGVERLLLLRAEQTATGPYLVLSEWEPRTRSERSVGRASIPSPVLQDRAAKELAAQVHP
jgi:hypothetical protein